MGVQGARYLVLVDQDARDWQPVVPGFGRGADWLAPGWKGGTGGDDESWPQVCSGGERLCNTHHIKIHVIIFKLDIQSNISHGIIGDSRYSLFKIFTIMTVRWFASTRYLDPWILANPFLRSLLRLSNYNLSLFLSHLFSWNGSQWWILGSLPICFPRQCFPDNTTHWARTRWTKIIWPWRCSRLWYGDLADL